MCISLVTDGDVAMRETIGPTLLGPRIDSDTARINFKATFLCSR